EGSGQKGRSHPPPLYYFRALFSPATHANGRSPYNRRPPIPQESAMANLTLAELSTEIEANVRLALAEDLGSGDITAQLIPAERLAHARVLAREADRKSAVEGK